MQKGFGLIGILIIVGVIAILGVGVLKKGFPDQNPFIPTDEEKSAIDMAEEMKEVLEGKSTETTQVSDTTEDETANWKVYEVPGWGVLVKHPRSSYIVKDENIYDYYDYENAKLFYRNEIVLVSNYQNLDYNNLPSDFWQMHINIYPRQVESEEVISNLKTLGQPKERVVGTRTFIGAYRMHQQPFDLWASGWQGYWNDSTKNVALYVSMPPQQLLDESISESIVESISFTSQFDEIVKKISAAQYIRFANVPSGLVLQKGNEFTIRWTYHRVEDLDVSIYLVDPTGKILGNVICCYLNSGKGSISWIVGKYTPYANAAELEVPAGIGYSFEIRLGSKDSVGLVSYRSNLFSISN